MVGLGGIRAAGSKCGSDFRRLPAHAPAVRSFPLAITLDFRGKLYDREVSRLLAFEDAPRVGAAQTICIRSIASVAHQTTGGGKLSKLVDRWNAVAEGECAELDEGPAIN